MRKRLNGITVLLFFFLKALSQDSVSHHYAAQISPENIKYYLKVLTADSLEGRETGKPGQKKAAQFIANHFRSLGLDSIAHKTFLQHTALSIRANKGNNFEINQKFYLFMKDYFYPHGLADSLFSFDSIAFCGYGVSSPNYDDYRGLNLRGAAVIFYDKEPQNQSGISWLSNSKEPSALKDEYLKKWNVAKEKGASLALIITDSVSMQKYVDEWNYSGSDFAPKTIPFAFISPEMSKSFFPEINNKVAERAKRKIDKKGRPQSFVSSTNAKLKFVINPDLLRGENVVGFLEGADKRDEVLVITGHYDHLGIRDSLIYPGADDNGSGTSAVMELAKVFAQAAREGHRPRRSILFMTVSGEEKGLLGSNYYVTHPLLPLSKTVANLNIDMIGRTDPKHDSLGVRDYVYVIGANKLSTQLHQIDSSANATFTKMELDYTFNRPDDPNRFYSRSDHYNFAKNNIPIIFYFNGVHGDYHKSSDTIDKIQIDLLTKRSQLVFLTAWELANREERIAVDVKNNMSEREE